MNYGAGYKPQALQQSALAGGYIGRSCHWHGVNQIDLLGEQGDKKEKNVEKSSILRAI
jgi:hypothetical protein